MSAELINLPVLTVAEDERISDAVTRLLRQSIVRHEIPSGTHLSVPSIAKQLNVSRNPVYDAIGRLVQEGIVTNIRNRGAFVRSYDVPSMISCYEVRSVLEGLAASLAAERHDSATLDRLAALLCEERKAIDDGNLQQHIQIDISFHKCILEAAANPVLSDALGRIYERIRPAMIYRVVPLGPSLALADHESIFESIRSREERTAEQKARLHIVRLYVEMIKMRAVN